MDLKISNYLGKSILHLATSKDPEITNIILDHDSSIIDYVDSDGWTALDILAINYDFAVTADSLLEEYSGNASDPEYIERVCKLHNDEAIIRILLERGASCSSFAFINLELNHEFLAIISGHHDSEASSLSEIIENRVLESEEQEGFLLGEGLDYNGL